MEILYLAQYLGFGVTKRSKKCKIVEKLGQHIKPQCFIQLSGYWGTKTFLKRCITLRSKLRRYSRLHVHNIPKKLALPCFSKILLVSCHTIFLGQILMGILKKQLKMQNLTHFLRYGDALYIFYIISACLNFRLICH